MNFRSVQIRRPRFFTTLSSPRFAAQRQDRSTSLPERASAEMRTRSALFLVPRQKQTGQHEKERTRLADWLFLALILTITIALCCGLVLGRI